MEEVKFNISDRQETTPLGKSDNLYEGDCNVKDVKEWLEEDGTKVTQEFIITEEGVSSEEVYKNEKMREIVKDDLNESYCYNFSSKKGRLCELVSVNEAGEFFEVIDAQKKDIIGFNADGELISSGSTCELTLKVLCDP